MQLHTPVGWAESQFVEFVSVITPPTVQLTRARRRRERGECTVIDSLVRGKRGEVEVEVEVEADSSPRFDWNRAPSDAKSPSSWIDTAGDASTGVRKEKASGVEENEMDASEEESAGDDGEEKATNAMIAIISVTH